jgi:hypothetical protein
VFVKARELEILKMKKVTVVKNRYKGSNLLIRPLRKEIGDFDFRILLLNITNPDKTKNKSTPELSKLRKC